MTNLFWLMLLIAYLFGSISGARVASWIFKTPNPLITGSGNPGASNMYRIAGRRAGGFTFLFDMFKALIPVYGSYFFKLPPVELGFIAVMACIGHIWPIYYGFKGGKGVATAFGSMLPIGLGLGLLLISTWLVILYKSRYSSLASICTAALAPLYIYWLKPEYVYPAIMLSGLIIIRHTANIKRLIQGNERTMAEKRQLTLSHDKTNNKQDNG